MNEIITKKNILLLVLMLVLAAAVFYVLQHGGKKDFSNQMSGQVGEVKEGALVVAGVVKSSDPKSNRRETKSILVTLTPKTTFRKTTLVIPPNLKPHQTFVPEPTTGPGAAADLVRGVAIIRLESRENLFETNKATAVDIQYEIFGFPQ